MTPRLTLGARGVEVRRADAPAYRVLVIDEPIDPFDGDPADPAAVLGDDPDDALEPLSVQEREEVLEDLEDIEVFQALLEPRGVRGLVVDCDDCSEAHFFGWDLLRGNLRHLLDAGQTRVHEPAFSPDPSDYVSWDYARGYSDAVLDAGDDEDAAAQDAR